MGYFSDKVAKNLLSDIKEKSQIMILEEGQEKEDLLESARKRGIIMLDNSRDLGVFKTIYAFTDESNLNKQVLPSDEFKKVLPQIVGRPVNINHNRKMIVGFYIDYKYIEKKKQAIAYGIFFKANYPEMWDKALELQKNNKLSSSYEIWSPMKTRKKLADGSQELHQMQIAGGALVFEENGVRPAFEDAKVLNLAMEMNETISEECLSYATKYVDEDIIIAEEIKVEEPKVENNHVICKNCQADFLPNNTTELKFECPNCKSIIDKEGTVLYPAQIKDYSFNCPDCGSSNHLITKKEEHKNIVKCSCGKEYELEFETAKVNPNQIEVVTVMNAGFQCPQCGKVKTTSILSNQKEFTVVCDNANCGVTYPVNIQKANAKRKIKIIKELRKDVVMENKDNKLEQAEKSAISEVAPTPVEATVNVEVTPVSDVAAEIVEKPVEVVTEPVLETAKVEEKVEKKVEEKKNKLCARGKKLLRIAMELRGKIKELEASLEMATIEKDFTVEELDKATINLEQATAKTELYKTEAKKIITRRDALGEFSNGLSDEQIMNDKDFEIAILNKKLADSKPVLETATETVGEAPKADNSAEEAKIKKIRADVDKAAFERSK